MITRLIFLVVVFPGIITCMTTQEDKQIFLIPHPHRLNGSEDDGNILERIRFQGAFDAAYHGELARLESLIEGVTINQTNTYGYPIIFSAIKGSHKDPLAPVEKILDLLIEKGACVDVLGFKHKMTALTFATIQAAKNPTLHLKVLEYFLGQNADAYFTPLGKRSAFDVALSLAQKKSNKYPNAKNVLNFFRNHPRNLEEAIQAYNLGAVKKFANRDTINQMNRYQKKPIFTAITNFYDYNKSQMLEIMALLLARGADPNEEIELLPYEGYTPLLVATIISLVRADYSMLNLLLSAGGTPYRPAIPHESPSAYKIAFIASQLQDAHVEKYEDPSRTQLQTIRNNKSTALEILQLFAITRTVLPLKNNY